MNKLLKNVELGFKKKQKQKNKKQKNAISSKKIHS